MDKISTELLSTNPSNFWKFLVEKFLLTLTDSERSNFDLASSKFAEREPHLYIKEVHWFKLWYKENKETFTF